MSHRFSSAARVALVLGAIGIAAPASALSVQDCSVKYQAAKKDGSIGSMKWNDFRKAQCGNGAAPAATAPAPSPAAPAPTTAAAPAPAPAAPPATATAKPAAPTPGAVGSAAYPAKVDPKYASESAGKARMKTCLASYNAAKASNTLGDTKWIMKGGGYYSECNKRLKG